MSPDLPSRPAWRTCLAIMFLALLVRAYLCGNMACISRDGVHFVTFARQLADDPLKWMQVTTKQPGMAWLLLGLHEAIGPQLGPDGPLVWQRCGQLIAVAGGVIACGLIYLLTRRLFDDGAAIIAGILAAFWWQGAVLSADVLSDMPHLALYLLALWVGYRAVASDRVSTLALCGVVAGLAYLLRQEALGGLGAVGICWLWPGRRRGVRRRLLGGAVLALCFAAIVLPYVIAVGEIMPNKGLDDLMDAPAAGRHPLLSAPTFFAHVIPWWLAPGRLAESWARSGRYAIAFLVLVALFLKSAPRAERTGRRMILAAVLLQILLVQLRVTVFGEISSRYSVILLALSIPWAATGFMTLVTAATLRWQPATRGKTAAICIVGIALSLAPQLYYLRRPINAERGSLRLAGQWLADRSASADRVLAHERLVQVMFYAGRTWPDQTWIRMPETAEVDDVRRLIEHTDPTWFVDVEGIRRNRSVEGDAFGALRAGALRRLQREWSSDPEGLRANIFRVGRSEPQEAQHSEPNP